MCGDERDDFCPKTLKCSVGGRWFSRRSQICERVDRKCSIWELRKKSFSFICPCLIEIMIELRNNYTMIHRHITVTIVWTIPQYACADPDAIRLHMTFTLHWFLWENHMIHDDPDLRPTTAIRTYKHIMIHMMIRTYEQPWPTIRTYGYHLTHVDYV